MLFLKHKIQCFRFFIATRRLQSIPVKYFKMAEISRTSRSEVFREKIALTSFAKFARKQLYESLIFNKAVGWVLPLSKTRDTGTGVFLWILWNVYDYLFYRTLPDDCLWIPKPSSNNTTYLGSSQAFMMELFTEKS